MTRTKKRPRDGSAKREAADAAGLDDDGRVVSLRLNQWAECYLKGVLQPRGIDDVLTSRIIANRPYEASTSTDLRAHLQRCEGMDEEHANNVITAVRQELERKHALRQERKEEIKETKQKDPQESINRERSRRLRDASAKQPDDFACMISLRLNQWPQKRLKSVLQPAGAGGVLASRVIANRPYEAYTSADLRAHLQQCEGVDEDGANNMIAAVRQEIERAQALRQEERETKQMDLQESVGKRLRDGSAKRKAADAAGPDDDAHVISKRLNQWSEADLKRLLQPGGVGDVFASRIIANRPYKATTSADLRAHLQLCEGMGEERTNNVIAAVRQQIGRKKARKELSEGKKQRAAAKRAKKAGHDRAAAADEQPAQGWTIDREGASSTAI